MADFENPLARKDFEDYLASLGPSSDAQPVQVASIPKISAQPAPVREVAAPQMQAPAPEAPPSISANVKDFIAKKYGFAPGLDSDALKAAEDKSNQNNLYANLSGIGSNLATAISGSNIKGDESVTNNLKQNADQPVAQVLAGRKASIEDDAMKRTQEENDPNSKGAVQLRSIYAPTLGRLGIKADVLEGMSAPEIKSFMQQPLEYQAKMAVADEARKANAIKAKEVANQKEQARDLAHQQKVSDNDAKDAQALQKDLEPDAGRTGNFGQISNTFLKAQRLKTLAQNFDGSPRNLTPSQVEELGLGLANMLGGGGATSDARVAALVPRSAMGDKQKLVQWLTNEPTGTNQQAFVKNMLETVDREQSLAEKQLNDIRSRRLGSHARLKDSNPDLYNSILDKYGMSAKGDSGSQDARNVNAGPGQDATILKYSSMHQLPYDQAAAILKARGYGQ